MRRRARLARPTARSSTRLGGEHALHGVELEQDLLEPQLVGLVHDDEQHLVMRRPPGLLAFAGLQVEQLVELQIGCVVDAWFGHSTSPGGYACRLSTGIDRGPVLVVTEG